MDTPLGGSKNHLVTGSQSNMITTTTVGSPISPNILSTPRPFTSTTSTSTIGNTTNSAYFSSPKHVYSSDYNKSNGNGTTTTSTGPRQPVVPNQLRSPCFVHSLLDQGVSLADWLQNSQEGPNNNNNNNNNNHNRPSLPPRVLSSSAKTDLSTPLASVKGLGLQYTDGSISRPSVGPSAVLPPLPAPVPAATTTPTTTSTMSPPSDDGEIESGSDHDENSFPKRLAETAVGVRELSKQLGTC